MTKLKTSISLDEKLLAQLDRQAAADGVSRSELIERMCRRSMEEEPQIEFLRFRALPTQIKSVISAMGWHDEDGPVELVLRIPAADWEELGKKWRAESAAAKARENARKGVDS